MGSRRSRLLRPIVVLATLLGLAACTAGVPETGKVVSVSPVTSAPPAVDPDTVQDLGPFSGQSDAEVAVGFMNAMNSGDVSRITSWVMPEAEEQVRQWANPATTVRVYSVFEPGLEYVSATKRIVPIKVKLVGQLRQGHEWHPATGEELISLELQRSGAEARVANPGPVIWMRDVNFSRLYASTEVYMVPDQDDPSPQLAPVPMFVPNGVEGDPKAPRLRVTRALQVLFAGPQGRYDNLETAIPPGTRLLDFRYANDLVTLNLSRAFSRSTGSGQVRIGQLVWTVNRLIPTASVRVLVEGHPVRTVGAERFQAGRRWRRHDPPLDGMWPQRSQGGEDDSILFVRQGEIYTIVPQAGQSPRPVELDAASPKSAPTWSPNHRWMAFVAGSGNRQSLWLVQPGGKAYAATTEDTVEGRLSAPSWSPDSKSVYLVVRNQRGARLLEVTRSTFGIRFLNLPPLPGGLQPASVAVSPDGAFLLAVAVRPDREVEPAEQVPGGHLYLGQLGPEGVEGWSQRQIAPGLGRVFSPVWVDPVTVGFIAETENKDDLGKLWTVRSDGWNPTAVLNDSDMPIGDIGNHLTVDPTGKSFVVTARSSTGASLWMVNRQDKSVSYLTLPAPNAFDTDPSFASR
ncbi:MAG: Lipoprotein LpqB, GerMN domain protein [Actinomycetia bacterium]|nr:Lipoprotein LpqB, GerMN domain protein [Actinomycetes bacterium]